MEGHTGQREEQVSTKLFEIFLLHRGHRVTDGRICILWRSVVTLVCNFPSYIPPFLGFEGAWRLGTRNQQITKENRAASASNDHIHNGHHQECVLIDATNEMVRLRGLGEDGSETGHPCTRVRAEVMNEASSVFCPQAF
jgi:hypothetical protein